MVLGLISLVLWFGVAFGLSIAWQVTDERPQPALMAGGIALIVAALPWLGYGRLVRAVRTTPDELARTTLDEQITPARKTPDKLAKAARTARDEAARPD
jgi:hypothetical protein